ncbi:mannose-6-phosphate isomerase, class I [Paeniglutamicibacter terrestris]|uniref:mannose-6-phosphate isomerase n=1 Tax=Paeniglutamicibacter terrestris TaxID=2723403 RepID=A0ABX1G599_9MICC|nr:mannose-6-phosphate isomerase, class I [Paeniglutamicibacter terrestris]ASN40233.1 mannose-6-phosphate isomerase, class I [Arthrobacter sp. 7749]NKG21432.1 mannose-6-phosphate isomerase, class I [Paeniglutamicibacter terrestris]
MHRLRNTIRDYAWGSSGAISDLLGTSPSGLPEAEMWLGAHPSAPSVAEVPGQGDTGLDQLITATPDALLGTEVNAAYGRLPFLMKVLAAAKPLSIQVHPSAAQAAEGFAAENLAGPALDSPQRNYKDGSHKPEMIYALTPFTALSGFRPPAESAALFSTLAEVLDEQGAAACLKIVTLLRNPDEAAALSSSCAYLLSGSAELSPTVIGAVAAIEANPALAEHGALAELPGINGHYPGDVGVLVSLLLNLVELEPGQAMYLDAGNMHAYLRGLGVEVMANSDNVLRGGLTPKHIDVAELLRITEFRALGVPLLEATETEYGQQLFVPPFAEFQLQHLELGPAIDSTSMGDGDVAVAANGPVIILCTEGELLIDTPHGDELLRRGDSLFIGANEAPAVARRSARASGRAFAVTPQPLA